jgi:hypothetical protein
MKALFQMKQVRAYAIGENERPIPQDGVIIEDGGKPFAKWEKQDRLAFGLIILNVEDNRVHHIRLQQKHGLYLRKFMQRRMLNLNTNWRKYSITRTNYSSRPIIQHVKILI